MVTLEVAGRLRSAGCTVVIILAAGCASSVVPPPTGEPVPTISERTAVPDVVTPPTPSATPAPTGSNQPATTPSPSSSVAPGHLAERPQVWFGPLDPWSWDRFEPGSGPHQFDDLFQPGADWQDVASHVGVFWLNNAWLDSFATDADLRIAIDALGARGIAIWTEAGQLTETPTCNASNLEGFAGSEPARKTVQRLRDAGGTLYAFGLEHGFDAATIYDLRCRMTPEEIARDTARTVAAVRSVFPDVVIGSVETANLDPDLIATWLQAYRDATGEELGYFHLDPNYTIPDWASRAARIADVVRSRGIEFGITYVGDEADDSDEAWLAHAQARVLEYEMAIGGTVDHAVFQSWHRHPARLLPETQPATFTHLIEQYLRRRTKLTLIDDGARVGGVLTGSDGRSITGATIELTALPTKGGGLTASYPITGTVPSGATTAVVGLRINTECDCSGAVEMRLDGIRFEAGDGTRDLVPNGGFAAGFEGWGAWGSARVKLVGRGKGAGLEIRASANQDVGLDSGAIRVKPGTSFRAVFTARIGPASAGHGYFDVVFLGRQGEVRRFTLPLAPAPITVGRDRTDSTGNFAIDLGDLPAGTYRLTAAFGGDDDRWPAQATVTRGPAADQPRVGG